MMPPFAMPIGGDALTSASLSSAYFDCQAFEAAITLFHITRRRARPLGLIASIQHAQPAAAVTSTRHQFSTERHAAARSAKARAATAGRELASTFQSLITAACGSRMPHIISHGPISMLFDGFIAEKKAGHTADYMTAPFAKPPHHDSFTSRMLTIHRLFPTRISPIVRYWKKSSCPLSGY